MNRIEILSWVLSFWSLGTMCLMSSGRYRPAWIGSLIGNVGCIYLSFASGLTGMAFYSIVMLAVASRGLWKTLSLETRHTFLYEMGWHSEYSDGIYDSETGATTWGKSCNDCEWTTHKD